jgi:hypothetical protein
MIIILIILVTTLYYIYVYIDHRPHTGTEHIYIHTYKYHDLIKYSGAEK